MKKFYSKILISFVIMLLILGGLASNLFKDMSFISTFNKQYISLYEGARNKNSRELISYLNGSEESDKLDSLIQLFKEDGNGLRYNKQMEIASVVENLKYLRTKKNKWNNMTIDERVECEKRLAELRVYYLSVN